MPRREDPVGSPANVGREAIGQFFDDNVIPVTLWVTDDPLVVGNSEVARDSSPWSRRWRAAA